GNGSYGAPAGDGQLAGNAQLNGPTALTVNAAGDLLIADNVGRNIRKVTPDGIIRAVASIPGLPPAVSGDGGPAIGVQLQLAFSGLAAQSGLGGGSAEWRWTARATCTSRKPPPIGFARFPRPEPLRPSREPAHNAAPARPTVFL